MEPRGKKGEPPDVLHTGGMAFAEGGRKAGAYAGAAVFLGTGLVPVLIAVNVVLLELAGYLGYRDALRDPGMLPHLIVGLGTAFTVLLIGSLFVMVGAMTGAAMSRLFSSAGYSPARTDGESPPWAGDLITRGHRRISDATLVEIRERIVFLDACGTDIRSVVLFGSAACDLRDAASDIDILIICTDRGAPRVREALFEREIDDAMAVEPGLADFEFTVLGEQEMEHLSQAGNPFVSIVGAGVVLYDDGFVDERVRRAPRERPGREYYLRTLYENIACQYLGSLKSLDGESREKGCTPSCCRERRDCQGLSGHHVLRRTVMRMLYAALPARGYLPLTRNDVIVFADEVYGNGAKGPFEEAIAVLKSREQTFFFSDYLLLKELAHCLIRELVGLAGFDRELRGILSDARNLVRGRYGDIRNPALRRCVS